MPVHDASVLSSVPLAHRRSATLLLLGVLLAAVQLVGCAATPSNRGRTIVVLGASSGFGKGVAQKLADEGANVVLAARRTEVLNDLAADCQRRGGQVIAVTTDVTKEEDVARLTQTAIDKFGKIDVWINLAGVSAFGKFEEIPLADQQKVIDTNLKGVVTASYYAMRHFRERHAGTLINISSVTGRIGQPYYAAYAASKFGVTGLGEALNQEVRLSGEKDIHVSTVYPFSTDTPFWDHAANYTGHQPYVALMDPPEEVIDLIVRMTVKPEREARPNFKTGFFLASHRLNRGVTANIAGDLTQKSIYGNKLAAPTTQGSVHAPMPGGTGVDGGVREKMKRAE